MTRKLQLRVTRQEALAIRLSPLDGGSPLVPAVRTVHPHKRIGAVMTLTPVNLGAAPDIEHLHLKDSGQHPGLVLMNAG